MLIYSETTGLRGAIGLDRCRMIVKHITKQK